VSTDLSIIQLVIHASVLVQLVMALLMVLSMMSWFVIFRKRQVMKVAQAAAQQFESRFWSGGDLSQLYKEMSQRGDRIRGMESVFHAGFREFARLRQQGGIDPREMMEGVQRAMRVALNRETETLEHHLPFLATVGSTSPYVGLFGTVWGIMNSFHALGNVNQATLAMVAPGISEALIATAMGLFAAIPAVIAYNRYSTETERLVNRYDNFLEEFSSVLQRQAHTQAHG
jgi:biopolymer transport protein TolQ